MRSCNGWFSGPLGSLSSFRFSLYIQFCLSLCWGGGVAGNAYFLSCHKQTQLNRVCFFPLFFHFFGVFLASKCQRSTIWLNTSVVSRIARGPRFESRSDHDPSPPPHVTFGSSLWVGGQGYEHQTLHVSFRADSRTNLIKQGRPSGSVAQ